MASTSQVAEAISLFLPFIFWGVIWGVVVFFIAKKRGENPWIWGLLCGIPGLGWLVTLVFMLLTLFSILDRLNRLEANREPKRLLEVSRT